MAQEEREYLEDEWEMVWVLCLAKIVKKHKEFVIEKFKSLLISFKTWYQHSQTIKNKMIRLILIPLLLGKLPQQEFE